MCYPVKHQLFIVLRATQGLIAEKVQEDAESRTKTAMSVAGRQQRSRQPKGADVSAEEIGRPGGEGEIQRCE